MARLFILLASVIQFSSFFCLFYFVLLYLFYSLHRSLNIFTLLRCVT